MEVLLHWYVAVNMFQNFCRQVFDLGIKDLKNRKAIDIKKTDCISGLIRRQTIQNIERIAERVLIQDIHRKKETGFLQGKTPEEQYRFYHEKWLDCRENVYKILKEFPELARLLFMEIQCNYELADEILEHLETDYSQIIKTFCHGRDFGDIREVSFMGDAHNRGKKTARVEMDNGVTVYYKPHCLQNSQRYQEIYAYLCKKAGISCIEQRYLIRDTYGWEKHIEWQCCHTEEEIRRYFFRMGIHLMLGYTLGVTDLHGENVMAHGEHPVIIDLETCPGYIIQTEESSVRRKTETLLAKSVLHTGILPVLTWGAGKEAVILSAVNTGKIVTPFRVPAVKKAETSEMYIDYQPVEFEIKENTLKINDKIVNAYEYAGNLEQGFRFAYEKVLTDKAITEMLEAFYDTGARVILRHTQQYSMYRFLSWHPDYVGERKRRAQLLQVMHREGETETQKKIHDYEIQDLLENDIPCFHTEGRERCIYTGDGKSVKDYFPVSPYESWKIHMKHLGKKDCQYQCDLIWLSMTMQRKKRSSFYKKHSGTVQKTQIENQLKNIINWIVDTAVTAEDGAGWTGLQFFENGLWKMVPAGMYLYDGICGIVLLLGEYLKYFQDEKAKDVFNLAVKRMCIYTQELEMGQVNSSIRTGVFDGECSVVYTFLLLHEITGEEKYLSYAEKHFAVIKKYFSQDVNYDLLSGNAGAAIAALKLYQIKKESAESADQYLKEAVEIEKNLWNRRQTMEKGCGWKLSCAEKPLAGMAHGNSGFLMLYTALYQITGNREYLKKINLLCEYENSLYSEEKENWLDLRSPEGEQKVMNAWCHGAPGILLARLEIEKIKEHQETEEDIKRASRSLFYGKEDGRICICHGLAGRILIMKKYLEQHKNPEFREIYNQKVQELFFILEQKDDLNASETRNPAFMNGISGVAYALLKLYTEMK